MRFDQFIAKKLQISERAAKTRIAGGDFSIDDRVTTDLHCRITRFEKVASSEAVLQSALEPLYIALYKPAGIVSATTDRHHTTVVDLIDHPEKSTLHLAGRLDRTSTGLVMLTNDSGWSESLSHPDARVEKAYLVETDRPIPDSAAARFAEGFHFASEGIVTKPVELVKLGPTTARVTLHEGRWHQIKRMFHRLDGIRLVSLHRERIGRFDLENLRPGEWHVISSPFSYDEQYTHPCISEADTTD